MDSNHVESLLSLKGSCCHALDFLLKDKVSFAGSTAYNASLASYWSIQEQSVHPSCIVSPHSAEDVSIGLQVLNIGGRIFPHQCQFAVRSGGHTPWASSANIQMGVTIDLQQLNGIAIAPDGKSVTVGPGNRWNDVYARLAPHGLVTSGGRVSDVGVGGLTLGGGLSFFSPQHGFVCDTVTRYEVVLPCGEIVNATETSYSDLWLALKGGSNNFGIVTAFEQTAFPQGNFWGGFVGNDVSTFPAQFEALEAFTANPHYDPYAAFINSYVFNLKSGGWYAANQYTYTKSLGTSTKPLNPQPEVFDNFTALPTFFSTMRTSNITDFTTELAAHNAGGRRQLFTSATFVNSAKMMAAFIDIANATIQEDLITVPDMSYSISYQPQPKIITSKAATTGGNSLGLDGSQNLFNALLTISWDTPADDARVTKQAKRLISESNIKAKELGVENRYIYLNYAAEWQDPIAGYGEDVKEGLQAVSRKYDPKGMFQHQCPGGFKLFD
ncbi:oxidoreductase FAD-binding protein [Acrodontium crateriforme]|uniref:Oxidoreductase FAD-binding protein n=1 Tax=Acrodontium crateriforme TaxID=150365 RepID=A0AAQ3M1Q8_9PEZI|nr:oxidoreductase FAD-binding protein [Acrodontium crateriforme]